MTPKGLNDGNHAEFENAESQTGTVVYLSRWRCRVDDLHGRSREGPCLVSRRAAEAVERENRASVEHSLRAQGGLD
jgi:hypothetical protein